jgi:alpha-D-xyloside xylohydrolase
VGWNWDTYKRQIVAGLNFTASGFPTGPPTSAASSGLAVPIHRSTYHDILTRWFQWGTFNPIFRMHGYQTETEPWKYGETVENNIAPMLNLRYRA